VSSPETARRPPVRLVTVHLGTGSDPDPTECPVSRPAAAAPDASVPVCMSSDTRSTGVHAPESARVLLAVRVRLLAPAASSALTEPRAAMASPESFLPARGRGAAAMTPTLRRIHGNKAT